MDGIVSGWIQDVIACMFLNKTGPALTGGLSTASRVGMGAGDTEGHPGEELLDIEAKVDIIFFVFIDLHWGQGTPLSSPMRRISENFSPQSLHLNSYIGINKPQILSYI